MNLSQNIKITLVNAAAVSAGTEIDATAVDMSGFDGVVFVASVATANAGNFMKAQSDTDVALGTVADLAGTKAVAGTNGAFIGVDVYRPIKRYVRPVVIRAGANTAVGDIYAIQYAGRTRPVVNAGMILSVSPADGAVS